MEMKLQVYEGIVREYRFLFEGGGGGGGFSVWTISFKGDRDSNIDR